METTGTAHARLKPYSLVVAILLVMVLGAFLAMRLLTGHGLGLGLGRVLPLTRAIIDRSNVTGYNHGDWTNVIFLHHSTGANLIEQGGVRERFTQAGYDFWDQGYNDWGLTRPDGTATGYSYFVPDDNTDPDGLAVIFAQRAQKLPLNAFSGLLQHEVIVFKSCFPASNITSDEQLKQYKSYYLAMRDVMDQHPDKLFVVMSPPPLNPAETDAEAATRARVFADWLKSAEYLNGHANVVTFDFFDSLAESDPALPDHNMLRQAYRAGADSHPNQVANETVAPLFVDFIINAIENYRLEGR
jgi:hypothetical protein